VLVADFDAQPLEGGRRGVYCVLRFASEEAARRWYEDPAYQPIKRLRVGNSANGSMMLVKGFEPPVSGRGVSSPRQAQAPGTTRAR
jgi:uncharacterized protein (DUF1330 family)